jgi:hypothetical protein
MEGAKKLLDEAGWTDGRRRHPRQGRQEAALPLSDLDQRRPPGLPGADQAVVDRTRRRGRAEEHRRLGLLRRRPGSPDTFQKFYADVEMYANNFDGTDPRPTWRNTCATRPPSPETQWQGENINRFCDPDYDAGRRTVADGRSGQARRIAKKLNDMLTKDSMTIVPLVDGAARSRPMSNTFGGVQMNAWDSELWNARRLVSREVIHDLLAPVSGHPGAGGPFRLTCISKRRPCSPSRSDGFCLRSRRFFISLVVFLLVDLAPGDPRLANPADRAARSAREDARGARPRPAGLGPLSALAETVLLDRATAFMPVDGWFGTHLPRAMQRILSRGSSALRSSTSSASACRRR